MVAPPWPRAAPSPCPQRCPGTPSEHTCAPRAQPLLTQILLTQELCGWSSPCPPATILCFPEQPLRAGRGALGASSFPSAGLGHGACPVATGPSACQMRLWAWDKSCSDAGSSWCCTGRIRDVPAFCPGMPRCCPQGAWLSWGRRGEGDVPRRMQDEGERGQGPRGAVRVVEGAACRG